MFCKTQNTYTTIADTHPIPVTEKQDGSFDLKEIDSLLSQTEMHKIKAICVENTHCSMGGSVVPLQFLQNLKDLSVAKGVPLHLDGARMLNAAVALDIEPAQIAQYFDSVTLCLTKGLGCPIGGVLAGSKEFIQKAKIIKWRLGGVMAQGGFVAAAGIFALKQWKTSMKQDHRNMRYILENIQKVGTGDQIKIKQTKVDTNILFIELTDSAQYSAQELADKLQELYSVKIEVRDERNLRIVTHPSVSESDCFRLITGLNQVLKIK